MLNFTLTLHLRKYSLHNSRRLVLERESRREEAIAASRKRSFYSLGLSERSASDVTDAQKPSQVHVLMNHLPKLSESIARNSDFIGLMPRVPPLVRCYR